MDENSYQLEQQLQTLQKQQREAETTLEALKRERNDQVWLEEDFSRICHVDNQQRSIRKELIQ